MSQGVDGQSVRGIVLGTDSGVVAYANISINNFIKGTTSDLDGKFVIENIEKGVHEIKVSALGYKKWKKKLEISSE